MEFKDLNIEDITKLVALATGAITLVTKLGLAITDIVSKSKDMSAEDKEELIKRIREAQQAIPEWE